MTEVFRMKDHVDGGTYLERKRNVKDWVMVMGRLADPKRRAAAAKDSGYDDPDLWGMFVSFDVDHYGFAGAFEAAKEWIEREEFKFQGTFEWKLDGRSW